MLCNQIKSRRAWYIGYRDYDLVTKLLTRGLHIPHTLYQGLPRHLNLRSPLQILSSLRLCLVAATALLLVSCDLFSQSESTISQPQPQAAVSTFSHGEYAFASSYSENEPLETAPRRLGQVRANENEINRLVAERLVGDISPSDLVEGTDYSLEYEILPSAQLGAGVLDPALFFFAIVGDNMPASQIPSVTSPQEAGEIYISNPNAQTSGFTLGEVLSQLPNGSIRVRQTIRITRSDISPGNLALIENIVEVRVFDRARGIDLMNNPNLFTYNLDSVARTSEQAGRTSRIVNFALSGEAFENDQEVLNSIPLRALNSLNDVDNPLAAYGFQRRSGPFEETTLFFDLRDASNETIACGASMSDPNRGAIYIDNGDMRLKASQVFDYEALLPDASYSCRLAVSTDGSASTYRFLSFILPGSDGQDVTADSVVLTVSQAESAVRVLQEGSDVDSCTSVSIGNINRCYYGSVRLSISNAAESPVISIEYLDLNNNNALIDFPAEAQANYTGVYESTSSPYFENDEIPVAVTGTISDAGIPNSNSLASFPRNTDEFGTRRLVISDVDPGEEQRYDPANIEISAVSPDHTLSSGVQLSNVINDIFNINSNGELEISDRSLLNFESYPQDLLRSRDGVPNRAFYTLSFSIDDIRNQIDQSTNLVSDPLGIEIELLDVAFRPVFVQPDVSNNPASLLPIAALLPEEGIQVDDMTSPRQFMLLPDLRALIQSRVGRLTALDPETLESDTISYRVAPISPVSLLPNLLTPEQRASFSANDMADRLLRALSSLAASEAALQTTADELSTILSSSGVGLSDTPFGVLATDPAALRILNDLPNQFTNLSQLSNRIDDLVSIVTTAGQSITSDDINRDIVSALSLSVAAVSNLRLVPLSDNAPSATQSLRVVSAGFLNGQNTNISLIAESSSGLLSIAPISLLITEDALDGTNQDDLDRLAADLEPDINLRVSQIAALQDEREADTSATPSDTVQPSVSFIVPDPNNPSTNIGEFIVSNDLTSIVEPDPAVLDMTFSILDRQAMMAIEQTSQLADGLSGLIADNLAAASIFTIVDENTGSMGVVPGAGVDFSEIYTLAILINNGTTGGFINGNSNIALVNLYANDLPQAPQITSAIVTQGGRSVTILPSNEPPANTDPDLSILRLSSPLRYSFQTNLAENSEPGVRIARFQIADDYSAYASQFASLPNQIIESVSSLSITNNINSVNLEDYFSIVLSGDRAINLVTRRAADGSLLDFENEMQRTALANFTISITDRGAHTWRAADAGLLQNTFLPEPLPTAAADELSISLDLNISLEDVSEPLVLEGTNPDNSHSIDETGEGIILDVARLVDANPADVRLELSGIFAERQILEPRFNAVEPQQIDLVVINPAGLENLGDGQTFIDQLLQAIPMDPDSSVLASLPLSLEIMINAMPDNLNLANLPQLLEMNDEIISSVNEADVVGTETFTLGSIPLSRLSDDSDEFITLPDSSRVRQANIILNLAAVRLASAGDLDPPLDDARILRLVPPTNPNSIGAAYELQLIDTDYVEASLFGDITYRLQTSLTDDPNLTPASNPDLFPSTAQITLSVTEADPKSLGYANREGERIDAASNNIPVYTFSYSQTPYADPIINPSDATDQICIGDPSIPGCVAMPSSSDSLISGVSADFVNLTSQGDDRVFGVVSLSGDEIDPNNNNFIARNQQFLATNSITDRSGLVPAIEFPELGGQILINLNISTDVISLDSNNFDYEILSEDENGNLVDVRDQFERYFALSLTAAAQLNITQRRYFFTDNGNNLPYNSLDTLQLYEGGERQSILSYFIRVGNDSNFNNASNYAMAQFSMEVEAPSTNEPTEILAIALVPNNHPLNPAGANAIFQTGASADNSPAEIRSRIAGNPTLRLLSEERGVYSLTDPLRQNGDAIDNLDPNSFDSYELAVWLYNPDAEVPNNEVASRVAINLANGVLRDEVTMRDCVRQTRTCTLATDRHLVDLRPQGATTPSVPSNPSTSSRDAMPIIQMSEDFSTGGIQGIADASGEGSYYALAYDLALAQNYHGNANLELSITDRGQDGRNFTPSRARIMIEVVDVPMPSSQLSVTAHANSGAGAILASLSGLTTDNIQAALSTDEDASGLTAIAFQNYQVTNLDGVGAMGRQLQSTNLTALSNDGDANFMNNPRNLPVLDQSQLDTTTNSITLIEHAWGSDSLTHSVIYAEPRGFGNFADVANLITYSDEFSHYVNVSPVDDPTRLTPTQADRDSFRSITAAQLADLTEEVTASISFTDDDFAYDDNAPRVLTGDSAASNLVLSAITQPLPAGAPAQPVGDLVINNVPISSATNIDNISPVDRQIVFPVIYSLSITDADDARRSSSVSYPISFAFGNLPPLPDTIDSVSFEGAANNPFVVDEANQLANIITNGISFAEDASPATNTDPALGQIVDITIRDFDLVKPGASIQDISFRLTNNANGLVRWYDYDTAQLISSDTTLGGDDIDDVTLRNGIVLARQPQDQDVGVYRVAWEIADAGISAADYVPITGSFILNITRLEDQPIIRRLAIATNSQLNFNQPRASFIANLSYVDDDFAEQVMGSNADGTPLDEVRHNNLLFESAIFNLQPPSGAADTSAYDCELMTLDMATPVGRIFDADGADHLRGIQVPAQNSNLANISGNLLLDDATSISLSNILGSNINIARCSNPLIGTSIQRLSLEGVVIEQILATTRVISRSPRIAQVVSEDLTSGNVIRGYRQEPHSHQAPTNSFVILPQGTDGAEEVRVTIELTDGDPDDGDFGDPTSSGNGVRPSGSPFMSWADVNIIPNLDSCDLIMSDNTREPTQLLSIVANTGSLNRNNGQYSLNISLANAGLFGVSYECMLSLQDLEDDVDILGITLRFRTDARGDISVIGQIADTPGSATDPDRISETNNNLTGHVLGTITISDTDLMNTDPAQRGVHTFSLLNNANGLVEWQGPQGASGDSIVSSNPDGTSDSVGFDIVLARNISDTDVGSYQVSWAVTDSLFQNTAFISGGFTLNVLRDNDEPMGLSYEIGGRRIQVTNDIRVMIAASDNRISNRDADESFQVNITYADDDFLEGITTGVTQVNHVGTGFATAVFTFAEPGNPANTYQCLVMPTDGNIPADITFYGRTNPNDAPQAPPGNLARMWADYTPNNLFSGVGNLRDGARNLNISSIREARYPNRDNRCNDPEIGSRIVSVDLTDLVVRQEGGDIIAVTDSQPRAILSSNLASETLIVGYRQLMTELSPASMDISDVTIMPNTYTTAEFMLTDTDPDDGDFSNPNPQSALRTPPGRSWGGGTNSNIDFAFGACTVSATTNPDEATIGDAPPAGALSLSVANFRTSSNNAFFTIALSTSANLPANTDYTCPVSLTNLEDDAPASLSLTVNIIARQIQLANDFSFIGRPSGTPAQNADAPGAISENSRMGDFVSQILIEDDDIDTSGTSAGTHNFTISGTAINGANLGSRGPLVRWLEIAGGGTIQPGTDNRVVVGGAAVAAASNQLNNTIVLARNLEDADVGSYSISVRVQDSLFETSGEMTRNFNLNIIGTPDQPGNFQLTILPRPSSNDPISVNTNNDNAVTFEAVVTYEDNDYAEPGSMLQLTDLSFSNLRYDLLTTQGDRIGCQFALNGDISLVSVTYGRDPGSIGFTQTNATRLEGSLRIDDRVLTLADIKTRATGVAPNDNALGDANCRDPRIGSILEDFTLSGVSVQHTRDAAQAVSSPIVSDMLADNRIVGYREESPSIILSSSSDIQIAPGETTSLSLTIRDTDSDDGNFANPDGGANSDNVVRTLPGIEWQLASPDFVLEFRPLATNPNSCDIASDISVTNQVLTATIGDTGSLSLDLSLSLGALPLTTYNCTIHLTSGIEDNAPQVDELRINFDVLVPVVDADGDGLIDISSATELGFIRNDLRGRSLNDGSNANSDGCPTAANPAIDPFDPSETITSCIGYELVNDIDLADADWQSAGYCSDQATQDGSVVPCTTNTNFFRANFEGNGHTISNINLVPNSNTPIGTASNGFSLVSGMGFFGAVANSTIRNLNLDNLVLPIPTSSGSRIFAGFAISGLVGYADENVRIVNVSMIAPEILAPSFGGDGGTGGLIGVGLDSPLIAYSSVVAGQITGFQQVGGLIGDGRDAGIIASFAAVADIDSRLNAGGLAGRLTGPSSRIFPIGTSAAIVGDIEARDGNVAGLIGSIFAVGDATRSNDVIIRTSYAITGLFRANSNVHHLIAGPADPPNFSVVAIYSQSPSPMVMLPAGSTNTQIPSVMIRPNGGSLLPEEALRTAQDRTGDGEPFLNWTRTNFVIDNFCEDGSQTWNFDDPNYAQPADSNGLQESEDYPAISCFGNRLSTSDQRNAIFDIIYAPGAPVDPTIRLLQNR